MTTVTAQELQSCDKSNEKERLTLQVFFPLLFPQLM